MELVGDINPIGTQNDADYVSFAHETNRNCYFFVKKKSEKSEKLNINHLVSVAAIEPIDGETSSTFKSNKKDPVHAYMNANSFVVPDEANSVLPTDGIEGNFA